MEIKESNDYCGPVALAFILGKSLEEIKEGFYLSTGLKDPKGTTPLQCRAVLNRYGYNFRAPHWEIPKKIAQLPNAEGIYMIVINGHWVTFREGKIFDYLYPQGIAPKESQYSRWDARTVIEIYKTKEPKNASKSSLSEETESDLERDRREQ